MSACTFAYPGTYGHECGAPATLAQSRPSEYTANGIYWARRCPSCAQARGGDNEGMTPTAWIPYDPAAHRNLFR